MSKFCVSKDMFLGNEMCFAIVTKAHNGLGSKQKLLTLLTFEDREKLYLSSLLNLLINNASSFTKQSVDSYRVTTKS